MAAQECCDAQLKVAYPEDDGSRRCLRTWDGFGCWHDTDPDSHVYKPCPSFIQHAMPSSKICILIKLIVINARILMLNFFRSRPHTLLYSTHHFYSVKYILYLVFSVLDLKLTDEIHFQSLT